MRKQDSDPSESNSGAHEAPPAEESHVLERRDFLSVLGAGLLLAGCGDSEEETGSAESAIEWLEWQKDVTVIRDPAQDAGAPPGGSCPQVTPVRYIIPANTFVQISDETARIEPGEELYIEAGATLRFNPSPAGKRATLVSYGNVVVDGTSGAPGTLEMVPQDRTVTHTLHFAGIKEHLCTIQGGGMAPVSSDVGLWVINHGQVDLRGTPRARWTNCHYEWCTDFNPDPSWNLGVSGFLPDIVKMVATAKGDFTSAATPTVAAPPASRLIYAPDGTQIYPEVFDLTRNVIIEGEGAGFLGQDSTSPIAGTSPPELFPQLQAGQTYPPPPSWGTASLSTNGRAHVAFMMCTNPNQKIEYVGLRHLGPRKAGANGTTVPATGRYALHFHMSGDVMRCLVLKGVVATLCGNRCFVAHASHGITFQDCVAWDSFETAYWWDFDAPGGVPANGSTVHGSNAVTYNHCAAVLTRTTWGFALGQVKNYGQINRGKCVDCVACMAQGPSTHGGFYWPAEANLKPNVWVFQDCVSHNNAALGIYGWENDPQQHVISRFLAYHNGSAGIMHGAYGNSFTYDQITCFGNGWGQFTIAAQAYGPNTPPVLVNDASLDGEGTNPCLYIREHAADASSSRPAIIRNSRFTNPGGFPVVVDETLNNGTNPGKYDFLNVTVDGVPLTKDHFNVTKAIQQTANKPSSRFRIEVADGTWVWESTNAEPDHWHFNAGQFLITADLAVTPREVPGPGQAPSCSGT